MVLTGQDHIITSSLLFSGISELDTVGELLLGLKNKSSESERRAFWHAAFYPTRLAPVQRSDLWQESDPGSGFDLSQIAAYLNSTKVRQQYLLKIEAKEVKKASPNHPSGCGWGLRLVGTRSRNRKVAQKG